MQVPTTAPPPLFPQVSPLRIAVLGFGTFGQFLARRWVRRGHLVYAQSRTDYSELARTMGVTYADCAADYSADYSELARTSRTLIAPLITPLITPSSRGRHVR